MRGSGNPDLARLVTGSQQPLETVYQKKPEIKTAIKLPPIAAWAQQQPQLTSSLSAISHIIGASVEQRSDFGHINTATSFVWPRYKKVVVNFVQYFPNTRTAYDLGAGCWNVSFLSHFARFIALLHSCLQKRNSATSPDP